MPINTLTPPMKTPLISILLINHNGQEHLEYCLPSLMETNYPKDKMEIILVDNQSTDDSINFVKNTFPHVKIIKAQNKGYGAGINRGLKESRGDYIAVLNVDIKFDPDWLVNILKPLQQDNNVGIAGPLLLDFDAKELPDEIKVPCFSKYGYPYHYTLNIGAAPTPGPPLLPIETIWVPGAVMLIKREVFEKIGGFDPIYFLYYEDFDFCFRTRIAGYKIFLVPASLVYHKESALIDPVFTPPEKVFFTTQNSIITFLKNYSLLSLLIYGLLFFILRFVDIINDLIHPQFRRFGLAKLRAFYGTLTQMPTVIKQRRKVQKLRIVTDQEIFKLNRGDSLWKVAKQKAISKKN
ncbi:glycosyltransferase family 2 protein [Patescibacteria group bacterium]|nr:glycosyltransferase family 2 protein [Patescibacteria group bacterium]